MTQRIARFLAARPWAVAFVLMIALAAALAGLQPAESADPDDLLAYTMTSPADLAAWYEDQQAIFLPVAPPDDREFVVGGLPYALPVEARGFTKGFLDQLIGEWGTGGPEYALWISQDPAAGGIRFWNKEGASVGEAAPQDQPYPGGARIVVSTRLIPAGTVAAHVKDTRAAARSGGSGYAMMSLGSGTQLVIARLAFTNGLAYVTVNYPESYTGTVWEVYSFDEATQAFDGRAGTWAVAETNLVMTGTTYSTWVDNGQLGRMSVLDLTNRYYGVGNTAVDSDEDGLSDGREAFVLKTDPYDADSDNDGLEDGEEVHTYGTDPLVADTDGDTMPDGWETQYGLNPTSSVPGQGEGWWTFDEGSGTNAANAAGTGYTGQLVNMDAGAWVTGKLGHALHFDGTNDYVRVPQSPAIITGQQFTASGWVFADAGGYEDFPTVISDMTNCGDYAGFWLGAELPWVWESLAGSCAGYGYPFATAQSNLWVHLVTTYDGTNVTLFVNGVLKSSSPIAFAPAKMSELRVGWADDPAYSYHWKGKLDDVRLYQHALTSNEVAQMYQYLLDVDGDGYNYLAEYQAGTSPTNQDTDGDQLPDGIDAQPLVFDTTAPIFTITSPTNGMIIP